MQSVQAAMSGGTFTVSGPAVSDGSIRNPSLSDSTDEAHSISTSGPNSSRSAAPGEPFPVGIPMRTSTPADVFRTVPFQP
jgi:hypothetical protein